jgi:hypothetical protein
MEKSGHMPRSVVKGGDCMDGALVALDATISALRGTAKESIDTVYLPIE